MRSSHKADQYYIDPAIVPPSSSYEWRTWSVLGEVDNVTAFRLTRAGWTAVPAARHPELLAAGATEDTTIIIDGMMLMERPKEMTEAAKARDRKYADAMIEAIGSKIAAGDGGIRSRWEPPIERRLSDREKEIALACFPQLVTENDPRRAYAAYERNKDQEARLRERYGVGVDFMKHRAMELALKAAPAVIKQAGSLVRLAGEIEGYLKETAK